MTVSVVMVGLVTFMVPMPPRGTGRMKTMLINRQRSSDVKVQQRSDLRVFPFSDWRFPSLAGYTGNTDTVYGVSGVRFLRTMEVVPAGTCSCSQSKKDDHSRRPPREKL